MLSNFVLLNQVLLRLGVCGILSATLLACSATLETSGNEQDLSYGVLVMAHGGGEQWDEAVIAAVDRMKMQYPVEIAFGMADAGSMEQAVRRLEAHGVEHVGVIRLFVSGESWYERTAQILGLQPGAPDKATAMAGHDGHAGHAMPMGFWRIETDLQFHMSEEGLADADEMDAVIATRISELSEDPQQEVVIVLAHGPGDDAENERWIRKIGERTELARASTGVNEIRVFTLREDWQSKRELAEEQIRDYLGNAVARGKEVLVVPYRVMGFGPYHSVLEGLDYRADETGLLPHRNVDLWLLNQASELSVVASAHHAELIASAQH